MSEQAHPLDHDHMASLRYLTSTLDRLLSEASGGRESEAVHAEFAEVIDEMCREVAEHFMLEDDALFPALLAALPALAADVSALARSHRTLDDLVAQLARLSLQGHASFVRELPRVAELVARFVAEYARHAEDERALFAQAGRLLTPEQRASLQGAFERPATLPESTIAARQRTR